MVLSKREKYVAYGVLGVLGLLVIDQFITGPLLASKQDLDDQIALRQVELDKANRTIKASRNKARNWAEMQKSGLRRKDASEAQGQILPSVRDWASDARMVLSSVKPERSEPVKLDKSDKEDFQRITFRATGAGGMEQIGRFLWRVQTATVPIRISDITITSRKENTDDLTLTMGVSTIYVVPEAEKEKPAGAAGREVLP